jgi:predicted amidohydrolase
LALACPRPVPGATVGDWVAAAAHAVGAGADLVVLPELAGVSARSLRALAGADAAPAAGDGAELVAGLATALRGTSAHVVTATAEVMAAGPALVAVAVGPGGPSLHQPVLHAPSRHPWVGVLGDRVKVLALPQGGLAVLAGDDLWVPEAGRLAALGGAAFLVAPFGAGPGPAEADALASTRATELGLEVVVVGPDVVSVAAAPGTVRRVCPIPAAPRPT